MNIEDSFLYRVIAIFLGGCKVIFFLWKMSLYSRIMYFLLCFGLSWLYYIEIYIFFVFPFEDFFFFSDKYKNCFVNIRNFEAVLTLLNIIFIDSIKLVFHWRIYKILKLSSFYLKTPTPRYFIAIHLFQGNLYLSLPSK